MKKNAKKGTNLITDATILLVIITQIHHRFDCQDFGQSTSQNNKIHCTSNQKCSLKIAQPEERGIFVFLKNRSRKSFLFSN